MNVKSTLPSSLMLLIKISTSPISVLLSPPRSLKEYSKLFGENLFLTNVMRNRRGCTIFYVKLEVKHYWTLHTLSLTSSFTTKLKQ